MAIIKCKMCGGDIELSENMTLGTCEYCGSTMTLPKIDDEQRAAAFNRGNHFRRIGEFDKALAVYERIVSEDDADAEAHWCCALCRFGIEYVEDPDSHEWLPTCHRASFDSILEDVDYKAAVEHSSGRTARRYTVEAEKIAEVQRGILRLSQSEQPFDVFICYKESDENGERTKDSTLAQDIYYQLTDKGLRVFFARITLEDKVGTEYEPYIFAALNSAKVMVVVGTKAEYVNAVWVKNEWSRFLSLMKHDRSKLLLPCYRDMDPYDLPDQLAMLQAYDMGKIGFMQDLIRGIEKVLGKGQPQAQKETVVVRGGGSGNENALLKRGNMALEDGDWAAADGFFDRVLDEDAENGEAFLGKFLASKNVSSLDDHIDDCLDDVDDSLSKVKLAHLNAVEPDKARIQAAVERYEVPNYFSKIRIEDLFQFDRAYDSAVQVLKAERDRRLKALEEDKLFSRAVRFAQGGFKATLDASLQRFRAELDRRISEAEAQDEANVKRITEAYAQHVAQVERELPQHYEQALAKKQADEDARKQREEQEIENRYQTACLSRQNVKHASEMLRAAKDFESLGDYKDSAQLAEACKERASRMQREEERKKKKAQQKKIAILCLIVAAIVAAVVVTQVVIPSIHYKQAETLMEQGDYEGAVRTFTDLGDFKDAAARIPEVYCAKAEVLLAQGDYDGAVAAFETAGDYGDAVERILATYYAKAEALLSQGDYDGAILAFEAAGDYDDAAERVLATYYAKAEALLAQSDTDGAVAAFEAAGDYEDAANRALGLRYDAAEELLGQGKIEEAASAFAALGDFKDAPVRIQKYHYAEAEALLSQGDTGSAIAAFEALGSYADAATRALALHYATAENLLAKGQRAAAVMAFEKAGDYQDARVRSMELWDEIAERKTIAIGNDHVVGLKSDGTVVATGWNDDGQCDVEDWTDIVAVAADYVHTVGLKSNGTVVATGDNDDGQCDVEDWTDIVAVAAGDNHTVGLKSDGTVVAAGKNDAGQCDVDGWTDIVAVAVGYDYTVGLKSDGTAVAVGSNYGDQCDVSGWRDIVAVAAGDFHTVGLESNGTVVATGDNDDGQCDVSGWRDIVAVAAGSGHTVGLKSDGTVVAVGNNWAGQCDVSDWTNIVAVAADLYLTVGLKSDGTVVTKGYLYSGCDVRGWTDIKLPANAKR